MFEKILNLIKRKDARTFKFGYDGTKTTGKVSTSSDIPVDRSKTYIDEYKESMTDKLTQDDLIKMKNNSQILDSSGKVVKTTTNKEEPIYDRQQEADNSILGNPILMEVITEQQNTDIPKPQEEYHDQPDNKLHHINPVIVETLKNHDSQKVIDCVVETTDVHQQHSSNTQFCDTTSHHDHASDSSTTSYDSGSSSSSTDSSSSSDSSSGGGDSGSSSSSS